MDPPVNSLITPLQGPSSLVTAKPALTSLTDGTGCTDLHSRDASKVKCRHFLFEVPLLLSFNHLHYNAKSHDRRNLTVLFKEAPNLYIRESARKQAGVLNFSHHGRACRLPYQE